MRGLLSAGRLRRMLAGLCLALCAAVVQAHKASDSYLTLAASSSSGEYTLRWDIALRDLDRELTLDADGDGRLSWGEVRRRWADIEQLAWAALQLPGCTPAAAATWAPALDTHSDGRYAVLSRQLACPAGTGPRQVDYRLFADSDATHRGILRFTTGGAEQALALVPGAGPRRLAPAAGHAPWRTLAEFIGQGLWHIAIGADHVLFLLSLLVAAVLVREPRAWAAAPGLKPALWDVLRVVTAFTLAHSVTLALAVLDVWDPPSRWVEALIAASVLLAALNNLRPVVFRGRWALTFAFGLVHGFGFAGALKDLGLGSGSLFWPLFGFNLGVELGQLLIVAVFMPLAWALRATTFYRRAVVGAGSLAIALLSLLWLAERLFDLGLPGFA